jgi:hypothetical protein
MKMPPEIEIYAHPKVRKVSETAMEMTIAIVDGATEAVDHDLIAEMQIYLRVVNAVSARFAAVLETYLGEETPDGFEAGTCIYDYLSERMKEALAREKEKAN